MQTNERKSQLVILGFRKIEGLNRKRIKHLRIFVKYTKMIHQEKPYLNHKSNQNKERRLILPQPI